MQHRTPSLHLDDVAHTDAVNIATDTFLPGPDDWDAVRTRMEVIVQRILVKHITSLQELSHRVVRHIPHAETEAMCSKSTVVNLGVIEANPASTPGVISILHHLQQYVPFKDDGSLVRNLVCNGDQLSVERMTHAKRARVRGPTPQARLEGFVETPQEFHREGLMMQVLTKIICYTVISV